MKLTGQGLRAFVCLSALLLLALFTGPAVNSQQFSQEQLEILEKEMFRWNIKFGVPKHSVGTRFWLC